MSRVDADADADADAEADAASHKGAGLHPRWLLPDWNRADVSAVMTTRAGGVSRGPWSSMNLGSATGDDAEHVAANRERLRLATGVQTSFLRQVHGVTVVECGAQVMPESGACPEADGCVTTEPGVACTVLAADCLPLLFAAPQGRGVAAAHAGWRGLAAGVAEATLARLCEAAGCGPGDVDVWLGACIGPDEFEVGRDVLDAFPNAAIPRFRERGPDKPGKWLADLPGLARDALHRAGVTRVTGGSWCTVRDPARFFSYRRDGVTGRMAASIWISTR